MQQTRRRNKRCIKSKRARKYSGPTNRITSTRALWEQELRMYALGSNLTMKRLMMDEVICDHSSDRWAASRSFVGSTISTVYDVHPIRNSTGSGASPSAGASGSCKRANETGRSDSSFHSFSDTRSYCISCTRSSKGYTILTSKYCTLRVAVLKVTNSLECLHNQLTDIKLGKRDNTLPLQRQPCARKLCFKQQCTMQHDPISSDDRWPIAHTWSLTGIIARPPTFTRRLNAVTYSGGTAAPQ